eukprot:Nitzschia sp. Nitz4//scaffold28_size193895//82327//82785//NITZ4_001654-RA/size193895-snap-gene-0.342-mRNA-1//-1//CDS//3329545949//4551//frame0
MIGFNFRERNGFPLVALEAWGVSLCVPRMKQGARWDKYLFPNPTLDQKTTSLTNFPLSQEVTQQLQFSYSESLGSLE